MSGRNIHSVVLARLAGPESWYISVIMLHTSLSAPRYWSPHMDSSSQIQTLNLAQLRHVRHHSSTFRMLDSRMNTTDQQNFTEKILKPWAQALGLILKADSLRTESDSSALRASHGAGNHLVCRLTSSTPTYMPQWSTRQYLLCLHSVLPGRSRLAMNPSPQLRVQVPEAEVSTPPLPWVHYISHFRPHHHDYISQYPTREGRLRHGWREITVPVVGQAKSNLENLFVWFTRWSGWMLRAKLRGS
jgi:hypothetical protein